MWKYLARLEPAPELSPYILGGKNDSSGRGHIFFPSQVDLRVVEPRILPMETSIRSFHPS